MKKLIKIFIVVTGILSFTACETNFNNVNQPAEDQVLTTKAGLLAESVGMTEHFATSTLSPVVEIPGLTTREFGDLLTFVTPSELVAGGTMLNSDNAGVTRLWSRLLRDKGMAESILANVDNIDMEPGTKSGLSAYAKWFKAITLGYLIQNFEQAPINNDLNGNAIFNTRAEVLAECINLLESAKTEIATTPISDEFSSYIPNIDLPNVINAFLARYNLFAGNYTAAITVANAVDLTSMSEWTYDGTVARNPVYDFAVFNNPDTKPQDNFGLTGSYIPEVGDGRISFYLSPVDEFETDFGLHGVDNALGFFTSASTSIPVFLPGEMLLIKAEAYARIPDLPNAVININLVREKTDDVYGVNAGLGAWTGDVNSQSDILNEIFKNRSIELFMSGMRFEDSRRIHPNLVIPAGGDYFIERNRNYYPYPFDERENNPNIPADPSI
ncbi:RagB/SusD family nutrient uptake outer membrane protein [Lutibacter sp.]|uniref:RagB/SusD family nutrient uptake outer membrane protein n=1 Tax=Lutibacter sp. TaxID=1925666 RepID=UPI0025BC1BAB|nr:RagB/SusD family nutrient uptake outer membrane protein [Lutibacter sp.]MCF6181197.1 RagB/SusD family nutrient uptake outer membrane protein [Lutibacter sp.]